MAVYDSYDGGSSKPWLQVGGTSLSAPCWAGLVAIADQLCASQGLGTLDGRTQTLPVLYALPAADFHDITTGSNGGFSAGPGYDLVTGRGTPIANLLVPALAGVTSPSFSLTAPTSGTYQSGQTVTIQWTAANVGAGSSSACATIRTRRGTATSSGSRSARWRRRRQQFLHVEHHGRCRRARIISAGICGRMESPTFSHLAQSITIQGNTPTFSLTGPTSGTFAAGQTVSIQWTAGNVGAGSSISLCYDPDKTLNGNEHWIEIGQVTAANGSNSYTWNTTGCRTGHVLYRRLSVDEQQPNVLPPRPVDHHSGDRTDVFPDRPHGWVRLLPAKPLRSNGRPATWRRAARSACATITDKTVNGNEHWIEIGQVAAANGSDSYTWNTAGSHRARTISAAISGRTVAPTFSHLTQSITFAARASL